MSRFPKILRQHLAEQAILKQQKEHNESQLKKAENDFAEMNIAIDRVGYKFEALGIKGSIILKLWDKYDKVLELRKAK